MVRIGADRKQHFATFLIRNRLTGSRADLADISGEIVNFAKVGIYSIDSADAVSEEHSHASENRVSIGWNTSRDQNAWMFERLSSAEMDAMFEINGSHASIRPLRDGITWKCGDVGDSSLKCSDRPPGHCCGQSLP